MLGKLMKHEFKALGRYFLPMFAFLIVLTPIFSLIIRLTDWTNDEFGIMETLSVLSIVGFVFTIYALMIAASILIVIRFYRTTATSEAYLTFTLPASPNQILISKWLMATVWQILSAIVMVICIIALIFICGVCTPAEFAKFAGEFFDLVRTSPDMVGFSITTLLLLPIMMIIGVLASTLQFYSCVMIGQLFNEHRVLASIGIYVAMYMATQLLTTIVMMPIQIGLMASSDSVEAASNATTIVFLVTIALQIILGVVYYIVTSFIMKKKLNVR